MKIEDLTAIGLTEEQAKKVTEMHGKEISGLQKSVAALTKERDTAATERDGYKTQLDTAEATLKKFDGIDPEAIKTELADWKKKAEDAKKEYDSKITARDQSDWLKTKLDEYGVASPYARKQLMTECMSADSGLKWKDGGFYGFDDFMKAAKANDASLYQTAEEKSSAVAEANAPKFTGAVGAPTANGERFIPPKIF